MHSNSLNFWNYYAFFTFYAQINTLDLKLELSLTYDIWMYKRYNRILCFIIAL